MHSHCVTGFRSYEQRGDPWVAGRRPS